MKIDCEAMIFDLDGTLVDSNSGIERVWKWWAGKYGVDYQRVLSVCHGRPSLFTMKLLLPGLASEEMGQEFLEREIEEARNLEPIAGAAEFLKTIPGDLWAVATSGKTRLATARLNGAGLPVPGIMVTADEIVHGKPHPEPFLKAAAKLGARPESCVVFEDSELGIQAALASGAKLVGVNVPEPLRTKYRFEHIMPDFSNARVYVRKGRLVMGI